MKTGYANGVPMGGDLPAPKGKAPTFMVWAVKDPDDANLDRIQIVKGWTKHGQIFEKSTTSPGPAIASPIRRPASSPAGRQHVDIKKATYTNTIGAVELKTVWTDPDFDPSLHAFYYARVLQIPTPRWTTIRAKELGMLPPSNVPATVQERAWTSPIWYTPTEEARTKCPRGVTVADLTQQGATALDDAQLKAADRGQDAAGAQHGHRSAVRDPLWRRWPARDPDMDGKQPEAGEMGDVMHPGGRARRMYEIRDGRIITTIGRTPFEVTVYKLGDKYVAARSNEFGYANYELQRSE